jgi:hypothetical protein
MSDTWPPDFGTLTRAAESRLVRALGLEPVALPGELAVMRGAWQGQPVEARARAYAGAGVELARFVTVEGAGLSIGNVLVIPGTDSAAPILGGDLVWIGTRPTVAMIAADLSPTLPDPDQRGRQNAASVAALPPAPELPTGGALPAWCLSIFSPSPLYTRFGRGEAGRAREAFLGYVEAFAFLATGEQISPIAGSRDAIRSGVRSYIERHRLDDRGLLLLERLFGKDRAMRFLDEVLFPIVTDGCAT